MNNFTVFFITSLLLVWMSTCPAFALPVWPLDSSESRPSELQMLDLSNERLGWIEKSLVGLENNVTWVFPELKMQDRCRFTQQYFESYQMPDAYQSHLLTRTRCLKQRLAQLEEQLKRSEPNGAVEKMKIMIPFLRDSLIPFRQSLDQVEYQLKTFSVGLYPDPKAKKAETQLVLLSGVMDYNFELVLRGRVPHLSASWQKKLVQENLTLHIFSSKIALNKVPAWGWDGPAFEVRIPLEDLEIKNYQYVFEDGELVRQSVMPVTAELSLALCSPSPGGVWFSQCLHSNTAQVYFPVIEASASVELGETDVPTDEAE